MISGMEMSCPNLAAPSEIMRHVVNIESAHNPYAIGVVGARLQRQPGNLREAVATARMLEQGGYNYSLGAAQINRTNLKRLGLDTYEKAFSYCPSVAAGSRVLSNCFARSGSDWGKALSCYYSGNFVTGVRHGYVQRVFNSMAKAQHGTRKAGAPGQPTEAPGSRASNEERGPHKADEPVVVHDGTKPFEPEVRRPGGDPSAASDTPLPRPGGTPIDPADVRVPGSDGAFVF